LTPYFKIYDAALLRIRDPKIRALAAADSETVMLGHLKAAVADFVNVSRFDLDACDDLAGEFTDDLANEDIQILAYGVAFYWASSQTLDATLFCNRMNTKDYSWTAPGPLLKTLTTLRETLEYQYRIRVVRYSYAHWKSADATGGV
jgi:hypothetical protein